MIQNIVWHKHINSMSFENCIRQIQEKLKFNGISDVQHIIAYIWMRFNTVESMTFQQLLHQTDDNFTMTSEFYPFDFKVTNFQLHKHILSIVSHVEIPNDIDIYGYIYEIYLQSNFSKAKTLGQFFTHKKTCQFMKSLIDDRIGETVADFSCGVGSCLSPFKNKKLYGFDIDKRVIDIAKLNLFDRAVFKCVDSLTYNDFGKYDIIVGNMPFGIKSIFYKNCSERIKSIGIPTNKSEPLFLHLIFASLNLNGQCAVVVPNSMLVNVSSAHIATRKYLVEHFDEIQVFPVSDDYVNTKIKTNILFFKKTGKPCSQIQFPSCSTRKLDSTYSLNENNYVARTPKSSEHFIISDLCKISTGIAYNPLKHLPGEYPYEDFARATRKIHTYTIDNETPTVLVANTLSIGRVVYANYKCTPSPHMFVLHPDESKLNPKYLYYQLLLHSSKEFDSFVVGIKSRIPLSMFDHIFIKVPSIQEQMAVVESIDNAIESMDKAVSAQLKKISETFGYTDCPHVYSMNILKYLRALRYKLF